MQFEMHRKFRNSSFSVALSNIIFLETAFLRFTSFLKYSPPKIYYISHSRLFYATFLSFLKKFFNFLKIFSECAPFLMFSDTVYMELKKTACSSQPESKLGYIILLILGMYHAEYAISPAINSTRCKSMIYSPFLGVAHAPFSCHAKENIGQKSPFARCAARCHSRPF